MAEVTLVSMVQLEWQVLQACQDLLELPEQQARQAARVTLGIPGLPDNLELPELPDPLDSLVLLDRLEYLVPLDRLACRDHPDLLETEVLQGLMDWLEVLELPVQVGLTVVLGLLVLQERVVLQGLVASKAAQVKRGQ